MAGPLRVAPVMAASPGLTRAEAAALAWFRRARRLAAPGKSSKLEFEFEGGAVSRIRIDDRAQISFNGPFA